MWFLSRMQNSHHFKRPKFTSRPFPTCSTLAGGTHSRVSRSFRVLSGRHWDLPSNQKAEWSSHIVASLGLAWAIQSDTILKKKRQKTKKQLYTGITGAVRGNACAQVLFSTSHREPLTIYVWRKNRCVFCGKPHALHRIEINTEGGRLVGITHDLKCLFKKSTHPNMPWP